MIARLIPGQYPGSGEAAEVAQLVERAPDTRKVSRSSRGPRTLKTVYIGYWILITRPVSTGGFI